MQEGYIIMSIRKYIYDLTEDEITELKNTNLTDFTNLIKWINNKLQEAFDTGRKNPTEKE